MAKSVLLAILKTHPCHMWCRCCQIFKGWLKHRWSTDNLAQVREFFCIPQASWDAECVGGPLIIPANWTSDATLITATGAELTAAARNETFGIDEWCGRALLLRDRDRGREGGQVGGCARPCPHASVRVMARSRRRSLTCVWNPWTLAGASGTTQALGARPLFQTQSSFLTTGQR